MKTYRELKDGAHSLDGGAIYIPKRLTAGIMAEVEAGEAEILPYVEPEKTQEQINAEHRAYLASTDWYITRKTETGEDIPQDILDARQAAREGVVE